MPGVLKEDHQRKQVKHEQHDHTSSWIIVTTIVRRVDICGLRVMAGLLTPNLTQHLRTASRVLVISAVGDLLCQRLEFRALHSKSDYRDCSASCTEHDGRSDNGPNKPCCVDNACPAPGVSSQQLLSSRDVHHREAAPLVGYPPRLDINWMRTLRTGVTAFGVGGD